MDIVVAGNGKVGTTLTEQLAKEGHNITIIDNNAEVIDHLVNNLDVMGIIGNSSSYDVLDQAGVGEADLFVAVTSADELNILSCMLARKMGAQRTIARVRNPEYSKLLAIMRDELGLSMVVNPELATAHEIFRTLRIPEALEVDSFARGRVDLVAVKVLDSNLCLNKPLSEFSRHYHAHILVCAVERDGEVIIPDGDFVIKCGDNIYITGTSKALDLFFHETGITKRKIKDVLIIGGGKIGYYLAKLLLELGFSVKIVEIDKRRCFQLAELLPRAVIIQGDGTDQAVLGEEGIAEMDACIALTDNDEENIILSMYAKRMGLEKVVTKVNRITFLKIIGDVGIDSVISPKVLTANNIVRYVRTMETSAENSISTLYQIVDGQAEAIEFVVADDFPYLGMTLQELSIKKNNLIACVIRRGLPIIPDGSTKIQTGDHVVVVTTNSHINELTDIIEGAPSGHES